MCAEVDIMRMRRRPDGNGMAVLRGLRRDRLETAQDRRRVCDYARDYRLDMAVGRVNRPEEGTMKQSHLGNRGLLDWPPDPVRLAGQRANTAPADANSERSRPHAANRTPDAVDTDPDPAAHPGGNPNPAAAPDPAPDARDDAGIAPRGTAASRI